MMGQQKKPQQNRQQEEQNQTGAFALRQPVESAPQPNPAREGRDQEETRYEEQRPIRGREANRAIGRHKRKYAPLPLVHQANGN
jgi:hypothetical protein